MSNVIRVPFGEIAKVEAEDAKENNILDFMHEINDWCEHQGVDTSTNEYRHQAAVIMTQLQIILMGTK